MDWFIEVSARAFEFAGIAVIAAGTVIALVRCVMHWDYHRVRKDIARSILLGLELLIGADIIATIAVRPSLDSLLALGLIVLIRTFLSFTLELEATGRLPWQRSDDKQQPEH